VSALDAMQGVQAALTPDEIYAHLKSFEKTLKLIGESMHASKAITFFTHNHPSTFKSQFTLTYSSVQRLHHKSSK
jgi:hypothetical protein